MKDLKQKVIGNFIPTEDDGRKAFSVVSKEPSHYLAPAWKGYKDDGDEYHVIERAWRFEPVWNGEGLPPVGCECEHCPGGTTQKEWERVTVLAISERTGGVFTDYWLRRDDGSSYVIGNPYRFRPIRTEAERRRSDAMLVMLEETYGPDDYTYEDICGLIYDAIAAGKIPGIRLTDD